MAARTRDPEEKRRRILQSTIRMFNQYGVLVPIARITEHAGVAVGTPFLYFSSKEELLHEAFLQAIDHGRECIQQQVDWAAPVREVVGQLIRNFLHWSFSCPEEMEFTTKYVDTYYFDYFSAPFAQLGAEVLSDPRILERLPEHVRQDCPEELLLRTVTVQLTAFARYLIYNRDAIELDSFCRMAADVTWNTIKA